MNSKNFNELEKTLEDVDMKDLDEGVEKQLSGKTDEKKEEKTPEEVLKELEAMHNEGIDRFLKLTDDAVSKNSLWRVIRKLMAYPDRETEVTLVKKAEKDLFESMVFMQDIKEMVSMERIRVHHETLAKEIKNNYDKAKEFEETINKGENK